MAALEIFEKRQFETIVCGECGCELALLQHHIDKLRAEAGTFYCPNGHRRGWSETDADRLRKQLAFEKNRREAAERERDRAQSDRDTARKAEAIVRGKLRAQTERIRNGVCPCCRRTFQNLQRHMATKHPGFLDGSWGTKEETA